jgi:acetyl-CoA C-acetyltransferase
MNSRLTRAKERGQPIPSWTDEMEFLKDPSANPIVAWPMKLFDCSPITDGAASAILVAEDVARNFTDEPIHIIGTGQASDAQALHGRKDITSLKASKLAAEQAYGMAGVTPEDIQLAEVHDCFTIAEVVGTEDLGFFKPGEGPKAAEEGRTARDGEKPVNTSGGLKAKGHPVGATGVGQLVEIWEQMSGHAGPRQVAGVNLTLTHNVGASGSTVVVHIFERR